MPSDQRRSEAKMTLAVILGTLTVGAATAFAFMPGGPAACIGTNLVAQMQTKDASMYRQLLAEAESIPNTEAVLWRIERDGQPASHLLGTVHLTDERVTKLSPAVKQALAESKILALERAKKVAPTKVRAKPLHISSPRELFELPDGQKLSQFFTDEEYAEMDRRMRQLGVPIQRRNILQPWFVAMRVGIFRPDCEVARRKAGIKFMDLVVREEGMKNNAEILGLETKLENTRALYRLPMATQVALTKMSLADVNRSRDIMQTGIEIYQQRRLGMMFSHKLHGVSKQTFDSYIEHVITERNLAMRDRALGLLERGNVFVAVGAMHLPGEQGLVQLFRDAGYRVKAVE